ncbi:imidazole glycerol phosphate synthase subunit HisH [Stenotrophobium rhamnosiphilum]|uniref:Imidazole glycerol phosphate synthase subunit HisH n=1 Tax=Stenotrophobium rhamnosiphilum TaxID=2029166 RepID=A0A2T5MFS6_9GAMM|nr:imidazole glycerol phosphate synthase subunit HisH [Stenotrophobium rhamnosiphilum]PTU31424.1 imidazole glycerol phosphate synthase subunit HisH [Stenotrophobium rhamnosiphilum]
MSAIGVIDYGMGNLHSLGKSLERVAEGRRVEISYDPEKLMKCDHIVLPGVGGVRACMNELRRLELNEMVLEVARKKPLLGICLGMQVMLEHSDENGGVAALGLFPGAVVRFPDPVAGSGERLKVPHMGWNRVKQTQNHPIWKGVPDDSWFYFVHSYHASLQNPAQALGTTDYIHPFASAIARDNIVAFQFHPEKSQGVGMTLLSNFVNWTP